MRTFSVCRKTVSVFPSDTPGAPVIYLHTFSEEGQKVFQVVQNIGGPSFTLAAISDLDWNRDMTPWDCPAAFKNGRPFIGGADGYLRLLTEEIISEAEKELSAPPLWRSMSGGASPGGGSRGTLWQGCSPYIRSIRQICFPGPQVSPAPSGIRG